MIVPSPSVLRVLLARYATARITHEEQPSPDTARRLADVSYTLCVLTGAGTVPAALAAADSYLLESVASSARPDAATAA
ncbi:DUF5133 domain-containing protein [Streptomyces sp. NPDC049813]|uniref:DUF5133 domain-containing protein n=1 Tax=Streptomyces sp. NPDC049813 TaxID=3365597 RepID=UPI00378ABA86